MSMSRSHLAVLLLGLLLLAPAARAEAPKTPPVAVDLFAVAWQQTSAEYKALCLQTYRVASHSLEELLRLSTFDRAGHKARLDVLVRQPDGRMTWDRRPLAVVMDLDETVIDNSGFQAYLIQSGLQFSPDVFSRWVAYQGEAEAARRSVPGALEFIRQAEKQGVTVIYVTNRSEEDRAPTLAVLRSYGISTEDLSDRLVMSQEDKQEADIAARMLRSLGVTASSPQGQRIVANASDKDRRRVEVMSRYHVVGYFGDNLYDFPVDVRLGAPAGAPMLGARDAAVAEGVRHWGTDWFILPNPMYGSWNSSKTIPRGGMVEALDDFGFGEYLKTR